MTCRHILYNTILNALGCFHFRKLQLCQGLNFVKAFYRKLDGFLIWKAAELEDWMLENFFFSSCPGILKEKYYFDKYIWKVGQIKAEQQEIRSVPNLESTELEGRIC